MVTRYVDMEAGADGTVDVSSVPKSTSLLSKGSINGNQKKFGLSSLDNISGGGYTGNGLIVATSTDFSFGAGMFTIEAWVRFNSHVATNNEVIVGNYSGTSNLSWNFQLTPTGQLSFAFSTNGTATAASVAAAYNPPLNQWIHLAVDRAADGTIRVYVDGVVLTSAVNAATFFASTRSLYIGNDGNTNRGLPGYIGGLRITKGVARYAGAFTPPTENFPKTVGGDPHYNSTGLLLDFVKYGDGTSKESAWRSINEASRSSNAGDLIKVMASPYETLVGDAAWINNSRTLTLPAAVTANISLCDAAWTPSANVTSATTTSNKQGTARVGVTVATAFLTGLAAYSATGLLDLSGYEQVSFWMNASVAIPAGSLSLRLCSDTAGAVTVHTIPLPVIAAAVWHPVTVDLGAAMSSSIQSIALYVDSDLSTTANVTVYLDNILACKAKSAPDSLNLQSVIGKEHNRGWEAATAYATGKIRRPSQPNRTGFIYKATTGGVSGAVEPSWPKELGLTVADGSIVWTCHDQEETWYPIQSINGTTVKLDHKVATVASTADTVGAYQGSTETVPTYKREVVKYLATTNTAYHAGLTEGAADTYIEYSGGWDRTDMSVQNGETWISGQNGSADFIGMRSEIRVRFSHFGLTRFRHGATNQTSQFYSLFAFKNMHFCGNETALSATLGILIELDNVCVVNSDYGIRAESPMLQGRCLSIHGCNSGFPGYGLYVTASKVRLTDVCLKGNGTGIDATVSRCDVILYNLRTARNNTAIEIGGTGLGLVNPYFEEASPFGIMTASKIIWIQKYQNVDWWTYVESGRGIIQTTQSVRHTNTGVAWRFATTYSSLGDSSIQTPLRLSIAKVYCEANVQKTISIWTRRTTTSAKGKIVIPGGQLEGLPVDVSVLCTPVVDTWVQSDNLTFTPTESGVVEVFFDVYETAASANSLFYIDDLSVK